MYNHIYKSNLEAYIQSSRSIPRKMRDGERLKIYHKYWLDSYGAVKVHDIFMEKGTEYYVVKHADRMTSYIPHPVESIYSFELLYNTQDFVESYDVINSNKPYTGSEIRFWFFINNLLDKYPNVMDYLSYTGKYRILDSRVYTVRKKNNGSIEIKEYKP